ncbi:MAG: NAD-dependent epimerase/dehydratase family protein [Paracoccaceae bacterium]
MNVLVTGANGFIGSNLCDRLIRSRDSVTGLVRTSSDLSFVENLAPLELRTGDITDRDSLRAALDDVSVVYHVAGYSKDWGSWKIFRENNVEGVRNVIETARECGVRRVVHVSSVSVYGFPGKTGVTEDAPFIARPDDRYVTTKTEGERLAMSYHGNGLEVTVIRPAGVYGPNDRTTTAQMAPAMLDGKFGYVDGGRHIMAPVYIDNLTQLIMLAGSSSKAPGEAYNAIDDGLVTWREYAEWMCEDLGCANPRFSVPRHITWPLAVVVEKTAKLLGKKESPLINKYRIRAVMADAHYSAEKAKRELGYRPLVSTREGISRTIKWYREYARLDDQRT